MGLFKHQPGCPCCCPECGTSYSDGGTTEQVFGTWGFGTNTAYTDDADALLIDEGEQPAGLVKFTAGFAALMSIYDSSMKFRCIFGYKDEDNYLYFESDIVSAGGLGGSVCQWTLHSVVGGVDTDTGHTFISGGVGTTLQYQGFFVCVDPYIDGYYGTTNRIVVLTSGLSVYTHVVRLDILHDVPGTRNGYGTGTGVRDDMTFLWPIVAKSLQDISPGVQQGETPSSDCNCACAYAKWSEWPTEMQVELTGVTAGPGCNNCDAFNATHVLDIVTVCSYFAEVDDAQCSTDIFANDPQITVRFYHDTNDSDGYPIVKMEVRVEAAAQGGGSCVLLGSVTLDSQCGRANCITDVQQLEVALTPTNWSACCAGTVTAYVTGIA